MILIVGLGNRGEKYKNNRHNVGFLVLDKLKEAILELENPKSKQASNADFQTKNNLVSDVCKIDSVILAKPTDFMNNSGAAVSALATFYKIPATNIFVVHDDLDLRLGTFKLQKGKGPQEHKGLLSIYQALGTKDFWHVRIGVDNRTTENRISGEDYVLQDFQGVEEIQVGKVMERVVERLKNETLKVFPNS